MNKPTQLTIEHIAAYLPYGVKVKSIDIFIGDPVFTLAAETISGTHAGMNWVLSDSFKLVLRPLSQLTVPITHNGETFVPIKRILTDFDYDMSRVFVKGSCVLLDCMLDNMTLLNCNLEYLGYNKAQLLLSWHFDVFGLIEAGLAVSMNPDGTIAQ